MDKYSEEITLTIDKPIEPEESQIGQPGVYPVGEVKLGHEMHKKAQEKEAKK
jgi:hypothetical protein